MSALACAGLVAGVGLPLAGGGVDALPIKPTSAASALSPAGARAALPVHFEPGAEGSGGFVARASGLTASLAPTEAHFSMGGGKDAAPVQASLHLMGADAGAAMVGHQAQAGKVNYFRGNDPSAWRTDVPTFGRVVATGVYPGVNLAWHGAEGGALEYDFVVATGADPSPIAVAVGGAESLAIDPSGDLVATLAGGATLRQRAPVAYQHHGKRRTPVAAAFRLEGAQVRFDLGAYDRGRPMIIDPVLAWSTYLGGSLHDLANSVEVDADGNIYVAGTTLSVDFPVTVGAYKPVCGCGALSADSFVVKVSPAGNLIYATYVGGSSHDTSNGADALTVSPTREAHVTGASDSPDFPLVGSTRLCAARPIDAFAFKLNATGSALVYSTCLGGEAIDAGMGTAVDPAGNTYVAGYTDSTDFPSVAADTMGTGGRCLAHIGDPEVPEGRDAFVTKISPTGAVVYSSCWGGIGNEHAWAVDADALGNAYVVGDTDSPGFPQKRNTGVQDGFGSEFGLADGWILKVTPRPKPAFSTYVGGNRDEVLSDVVAKANAVYVLGGTYSTDLAAKWPAATASAYQPALAGQADSFVARLVGTGLVPAAPALDRLTYIGGGNMEFAASLAVRGGKIWVTGSTEVDRQRPGRTAFPTVGPLQADCAVDDLPESSPYRGPSHPDDAYVARFDKALSTLEFSTCMGGNGDDSGNGVAVDATGNAYVVGRTLSPDDDPATPEVEKPFPTTPGALDRTCGSDGRCDRDNLLRAKSDAFLAKISP